MGFFRVLLALMVLVSHTEQISWIYGVYAVECFFAISGFYMQMILSEDYANQPYWRVKFYSSRLLRIFAGYWAVLALMMLVHVLQRDYAIALVTEGKRAFAIRSVLLNLFVVGMENVKLYRFGVESSPMFSHLLLPQAWSVGIELLFYALAPFMLRRFAVLLLVTLASAAAKAYFLVTATPRMFDFSCWDGLINGIFPLELCIFGAGALAYRFYARFLSESGKHRGYEKQLAFICLLLVMTCLLRYGLQPWDGVMLLAWYGCLLVTVALIPFLFAAFRHSPIDRFIGDLSYPIYLIQELAVKFVMEMFEPGKLGIAIGGCIFSILLALPITILIDRPLTRFRHRRLRHAPHPAHAKSTRG